MKGGNSIVVGRLEKVDLREVWANESKNFTTWLEIHLDILSEHIGVELSLLEREKSVGTFSADIFAEGKNGDTVVIENQLEKPFKPRKLILMHVTKRS